MKIDVFITDSTHPTTLAINKWRDFYRSQHDLRMISDVKECVGGDLLFLVACHQMIPKSVRGKYKKVIVTHASDLPKGRGWSPAIWTMLEGGDKLTLSLMRADDALDTGPIYKKFHYPIQNTDVHRDMEHALRAMTWKALDFITDNFDMLDTYLERQVGEASYYPRRYPSDSELDPHKTIAEQFDLMRVCNPYRYPAFFELRGQKYTLTIEKKD